MDTGEEEPQRIRYSRGVSTADRYSRGVSVADDTAEEEPQQIK